MNKNVLVTGVSRGIGNAIARKLVEEGYFVHGTYNSSIEEAEKLKAEIKNIELYQVNLSKRDQTLSLIQKLKAIQFHGLVNDAGIFRLENFDKYDMSVWDEVFEVNLNSILLIILGLKDNLGSGSSIVNIASTDGMIGSFAGMSYSASKAALINLTKSLGNNLGSKGIRVNAIAPGWINTSMDTAVVDDAAELNPLGKNGKPMEVAEVVSFLLSDKASYVNGATWIVDGGYTNVDSIMKKEAKLVE